MSQDLLLLITFILTCLEMAAGRIPGLKLALPASPC